MFKLILVAASFVSMSAFAVSPVIENAAAELKASDVRTVITEGENTDENPCLPEGKYFQIDLQVKKATFSQLKRKTVYSWQTVKTVATSTDGKIIEVCAE